MPYQIDYELKVPYPGQPDGFYYWTNAWIVNASTDAQASTRFTQIDNAVDGMTLQICRQVWATRKRAPGMGGVYSSTTLFNDPGSYPNGSVGFTLLAYCRVDLFVGGEKVGYKRWRMPIRNDHIIGPLFAPAVITALNTRFGNLVSAGCLAARDGRVIDSFLVDPRVRQWQLRHGTERRRRVVL